MKFSLFSIIFICFCNINFINSRKLKNHIVDPGCNECGLTSGGPVEPHIINGRPVIPTNKYPWVVALMWSQKFCAGSIISSNFIMTAAHCLARHMPEYIDDLRIGFVTRTKAVKIGPKVKRVIVHPGFKVGGFSGNDIALIELAQPIVCNNFARPICLPKRNDSLEFGHILTAAGWGTTDGTRETPSDRLKEGNILFSHPKGCSPFPGIDFNTSICVKGYKGDAPCYGDSGSSAFTKYQGRYFSFGILSAGFRDCGISTGLKFGVIYTSVKAFAPWIRRVTGIRAKAFQEKKRSPVNGHAKNKDRPPQLLVRIQAPLE